LGKEELNSLSVEAQVEALITKKLGERLPHVCMTCDYFQFNIVAKQGVARNRYCQYPGEITLAKGVCQKWVLANDLSSRHPRNITI